jgi:uncharacterized protein
MPKVARDRRRWFGIRTMFFWFLSTGGGKMRIIILLSALLLLTTPYSGLAASFDCSKASTKVEKIICSSDELSKADELLAQKYKRALKEAQDRKSLIGKQRQWLEERNVVTSEAELLNMYKDRIRQLDEQKMVVQSVSDASIGATSASKRAYVFNGDMIVVDTASDRIIDTLDIHEEVRNIYDAKVFLKADTVFMKDDYRILKLNLKTSEIIQDDQINTQWEHVNFLLSPDGNFFYVIWLPYHSHKGERKITQYDANLRATVIENLEVPDSTHLIDFSGDGSKLYVVYGHGKKRAIRVIDFRSHKIIKEISFAEFGRNDVFTKTSADIKNNKILIVENEKDNDKYVQALYIYDAENGAISKPIKTSMDAHRRLIGSGDKIICDEIEHRGDMVFNLDKLHLYDGRMGKQIGFIDMKTGGDYHNELAGLTPDGKKVYYRTRKGLNVIDAETFTLLKTLNFTGSLMSFAGY